MEIKQNLNNSVLELIVSGKIDTPTSPELEKAVLANADSLTDLIIDMSEVNYISSAGIRVILLTAKKFASGKRFVIRKPSEFVMQVFDATGIKSFLTIQ